MGRKGGRPSHRPVRVGEQVKARLSELLLEGTVKDPRIQRATLVSVTDVQMTPDLKRARVYVSVFGADEADGARGVIDALQACAGLLKNQLSADLGLRFTPHLDFRPDESIAQGAHMEQVIRDVRSEDASRTDDALPGPGERASEEPPHGEP
jgi:ribosome-binding factor A